MIVDPMSPDDAISKLPSEVLFQIFSQMIGFDNEICKLCLVSKLWNVIASDNVLWKTQYKEKFGTTDIIVIFNGSDLYSHSHLDFSWKFVYSRRFKIERKVLKKLSEAPPEAPSIGEEAQQNSGNSLPLSSAGDLFKFGKKIEKYGRVQHDYVKRLNYLQVATEVYSSAVGLFVKPHTEDESRSARSMFYLSVCPFYIITHFKLFYSRWSSVYSQLAEKLLRKAQRRKLGHLKQNENSMKEDIVLGEVDLSQLFQTAQYILELAESILEKAKSSVTETDGWYSNLLSAETRVLLNMLECKQAVNVELSECNKVWEKMQTSLQKAIETQPNNGDILRTYADALRARGRMLAQYNPANEEIDQIFQQTIELIKKQLVRCPGDQWLLNDLALVYGTQGKVCLRAGDKVKALQYFKQSIKLLKEYRTTAAEDRFESVYNLACFYALSYKPEKCYEMLKLLHADSNLYESDLLEDDDFNNVRGCTWFADLLRELRSSNKLVRDMKSLNLDWV